MLIPAVIAGLLLLGYWLWLRSQELFRIQIRGGKLMVTRGYAPVGLLNDFGTAARGVQHGQIRAHKGQGGGQLSFSGDVDAAVAQRLRNVFGLYPVARLRAPYVDKRRAVSDAFTVAWFVSLLRGFFK